VFVIESLDAYTDEKSIPKSDYLLENVDFTLNLEQCILQTAVEFPKFKAAGSLPRLHFNFSHKNIRTMQEVIKVLEATLANPPRPTLSKVEKIPRRKKDIVYVSDDSMEFHDATEYEETSPIDAKPVERIILTILFHFDEASISIFEPNDTEAFALFYAKGIKASASYCLSMSKLTATLASLVLEDGKQPLIQYRNLISEDNCDKFGSPLVTLDVLHTTPQSVSKASSSTVVKLEVNPIRFVFSREGMLRIYRFFSECGFESYKESEGSNSDDLLEPTIAPTIGSTFMLNFKLHQVTFVFAENGMSLATSKLESVSLECKTFGRILSANGTIGKVQITDDCNNFCDILKIEDSKTADFSFDSYQRKKGSPSDSFLKLNASSVRLHYYTEFISRMTSYFQAFREMQVVLDSASQVAQNSAIHIQESVGKFGFSMSVKTPIVDIPNPLNESDRLILYLGQIDARTDEATKDGAVDYNISVTSMKLQSVFSTSEDRLEMNMIEDINFDIQVKSGLENEPSQQVLPF
jgi:Repeating coiled region of VPS13